MQQSLTALEAIGFMNSVGREETPLIETPIYRSVEDHNLFFAIESGEALPIDLVDLEEAERDQRWTWLSHPAPWVTDGVVLATEDITDVESQQALPVLRIYYCSRAEARHTLARLAKAYLKQGLQNLDAETPSVEQALRFLRKAYRSHPNAVGLLVLCWGCARLQRDEPSEFFECRRIADRLTRLVNHATPASEHNSTQRRWLEKVVIDLDSGHTKVDFGNFGLYEHGGVPDATSITIMGELLSFCCRNDRWSPYRDVVFALSAQALLYELAVSSDAARAIANLHLNDAYTFEVIEHGQITLHSGVGLVKAIVQDRDADVSDLAGRILGAIARLTRNVPLKQWDQYQQAKPEPSGASLRFAFSMALVEANDILTVQPYNEIRNRSGLAKAAEHLGRFHVVREQALRLIELSYKLDEVEAEATTRDQIIKLRHSRENIADACRQLGNWELKRGTADAAGAYFDMAHQRFLRVMPSFESEDFGRVGERLAYCTLKLAQITSDEELATESFSYYDQVQQWAADRDERPPRWFIEGYKYAAKLSGRSDAPSSYGEDLIKWTATESEYAPTSIEVEYAPLSMFERRLREIQEQVWNDPRTAASAAAEIEESIQNNPQLRLFWIRTRGLRLQALVRTGGSTDILLARELSDELAKQAESAQTDTLEQGYVYEELVKYFQRAGDFRSARHWNEQLLSVNSFNKVASMRLDLINARLAQTANDAANARTMLLHRAQELVQYDDRDEAAGLYFAAGEVAMLGYARWADPNLAEVEHCYRKATAIRNPPRTAALYRLAWVLFEKGELREAIDQLESLPIDDARAAGLFVRIALAEKNDAERRLSEAAERLERAWDQWPLDRFLARHVVDLTSADPVLGARLCGRIIQTSLERDQMASAEYLCRALATRSLFHTEITDKVLKYVTQSSTAESKFFVYLHASLLRTLVDTNEDAKSLWMRYFKREHSGEHFKRLIKPIAVPVGVRALELLEGHQSELNRELHQKTWPRELIASVRDEISTGRNWLDELRQVPDDAKRRSLNGVKMELVDGLRIGTGEFWEPRAFKSVISNLEGPRAIVIDVDLLRAVASVYCRGTSKEATLTIADAKPGKVCIEISDLDETALGRAESEDKWSHYVVTDLLGGSLTKNGLELPMFLSAGDD